MINALNVAIIEPKLKFKAVLAKLFLLYLALKYLLSKLFADTLYCKFGADASTVNKLIIPNVNNKYNVKLFSIVKLKLPNLMFTKSTMLNESNGELKAA